MARRPAWLVAVVMTQAAAACTWAPAVPVVMDVPTTRMSPSDVIAAAEELSRDGEAVVGQRRPFRVVSVTATTARQALRALGSSIEAEPAEDAVVWVVLAEGTFLRLRGRMLEPIVVEKVTVLVSDEDGSVLGVGDRAP